jgi:putative peptidoglycan lipid II flippase
LGQKASETDSRRNAAADIVKKGSVITIITLISRPIGFLREAIQAYLFGATMLVDAFVVAFVFPELIQTLFVTGATSAFLIPVCSRYVDDTEEFSRIYGTFVNLAIIILGLISLILFFCSSHIMGITGFKPETQKIAAVLFVIMIPVITLHAILSVQKAFLNVKYHFAAPEMSGILWNIIFILSALVLKDKIGIYSLAVGVSAGSLAQVLMQIPWLRRNGIRYRFSLSLKHPSVKEARKLFIGALIATSVVPINSVVDKLIGSHLPPGQVASLAYAFRIFILPFSLFAVPVYTVLFPTISRLYHQKDWGSIRSHIDSSMVLIFITLVPSTILLCLNGNEIFKILYERGAFVAKDTVLAQRALFGFGIGLLFYALSISFVRIFNAIHDVKTPTLVGIGCIALNAILDYILMKPFQNMGIALSTSIASFYNFLMLYLILRKRIGYKMSHKTMRDIIKSLLAGVLLALLIYLARHFVQGNPYISLLTSTFLAIVVYGLFFRHYYPLLLKKNGR